MFLIIDGTLIVQIINFIVFIAVLNVVFLKPVGAAIAKRRATIDGIAREAEDAARNLRDLQAQASDRTANARREADATVAAARAQAQNDAAAILEGFQGRASSITTQAQAQVAEETAQARANEPAIVDSLAATMVDQALAGAAK